MPRPIVIGDGTVPVRMQMLRIDDETRRRTISMVGITPAVPRVLENMAQSALCGRFVVLLPCIRQCKCQKDLAGGGDLRE
ncbi:hypothetical protein BD410DRAFT_792324 [Rickenella mellea]|uniref:Uncharacterized protein n=1 Tax=Rickenella mellea TaxID=50990 RepID=A0A4Y7PWL0_9AGAM|nr:hypothetical protein BD410DRAFT_792324 [Rickenella mellea]